MERVTALRAFQSGLRRARMINATLLVNHPDTTIAVGFGDNGGNLLEIHTAARHMRRESSSSSASRAANSVLFPTPASR